MNPNTACSAVPPPNLRALLASRPTASSDLRCDLRPRMDSREDSLPVACSQPSPSPYCSFHLPDDASGTFERGPLWGVHLLHLLELEDIAHIRSLAAAHVNEHGWSTSRHRHHPTTDFAVDEAPALDMWLRPLVQKVILPVMARLYAFEEEGERLSIRDLFYVRYDAAAQDRLSAHRDGTLLSFSVLLSEPGRDFEGGGTRFSSLGGACEACGSGSAASGGGGPGSCAQCGGSGFAPLPQRLGDLTVHCGKLLHEGAPVTRGERLVLVGFVEVCSPRVDREFVEEHLLANSSKVGGWADHECVGNALLDEEDLLELQASRT